MAFPVYVSHDMTLEPNPFATYVSPQPVVGTVVTASVCTDSPDFVPETLPYGQSYYNTDATPLVGKDEDVFDYMSNEDKLKFMKNEDILVCLEDENLLHEIAVERLLNSDGVVFQPLSHQTNNTQSQPGFVDLDYQQVGKDGVYPTEGATPETLLHLSARKATTTTSISNLTNVPANKKPKILEEKEKFVAASKWVESEELFPWNTPTKVASYNANLRKFKCENCKLVGLLNQIAEHWIGIHCNVRVFQCPCCEFNSTWAHSIQMHLKSQHKDLNPHDNIRFHWKKNPVLNSVIKYLLRLKNSVSSQHKDMNSKNQTMTVRPTATMETSSNPPAGQLQQQSRPATVTAAHPSSSSGDVKKKKKIYACTYCNWQGKNTGVLNRHLNTHNKPFACTLCEHRAARKDNLATHVLNVHKKWLCSKCFFVADDKEALDQHKQEQHD